MTTRQWRPIPRRPSFARQPRQRSARAQTGCHGRAPSAALAARWPACDGRAAAAGRAGEVRARASGDAPGMPWPAGQELPALVGRTAMRGRGRGGGRWHARVIRPPRPLLLAAPCNVRRDGRPSRGPVRASCPARANAIGTMSSSSSCAAKTRRACCRPVRRATPPCGPRRRPSAAAKRPRRWKAWQRCGRIRAPAAGERRAVAGARVVRLPSKPLVVTVTTGYYWGAAPGSAWPEA